MSRNMTAKKINAMKMDFLLSELLSPRPFPYTHLQKLRLIPVTVLYTILPLQNANKSEMILLCVPSWALQNRH